MPCRCDPLFRAFRRFPPRGPEQCSNRNHPRLTGCLTVLRTKYGKRCQRHYVQYAKISALADAIEQGAASPEERDALFALLMQAVIRFELNAQTDVEAFRRVCHRVMRSLLEAAAMR